MGARRRDRRGSTERRRTTAGGADSLEATGDVAETESIDRFLRALAPYAVASIPFVITIWALIRISGGNPNVIFLILRESSVPAILFSVLNMVMPIVLALLYIFVLRRLHRASRTSVAYRYRLYLPVSAFFVSLTFFPIIYSIPVLVVTLSVIVFKEEVLDAALRTLGNGMLVLGFMLIAVRGFSDPMVWFPRELVETDGGDSRVSAYVLESTDHDLTVLHADDFRPEIIRQDDVVRRTLCADREEQSSWAVKVYHMHFQDLFRELVGGKVDPRPLLPECSSI